MITAEGWTDSISGVDGADAGMEWKESEDTIVWLQMWLIMGHDEFILISIFVCVVLVNGDHTKVPTEHNTITYLIRIKTMNQI